MTTTREHERVYEYPVNALHSTVLGYATSSKGGKQLWAELDWRGVFKDGGIPDWQYLHVRCYYNRDQDGPPPVPLRYRREYRVRCLHYPGTRWRRGIVTAVEVVKRRGKWFWIVTTSKKPTPASERSAG